MKELKLYGHEEYINVTERIKDAASKLKVGELVTEPGFQLYQVVHALEVGSDRMDTGLIFKPLQEELENAPRIESSNDIIKFIDSLFRREMSWHEGFSLMQNLLSCVFVEEILEQLLTASKIPIGEEGDVESFLNQAAEEISNWRDVAKVYLLGTIKSVELSIQLFSKANGLIQDEDIIVNSAGYYLLENIQKDRIVQMLKKALTWVKKQECPQVKHRLELRILLLHILADKVPKVNSHVDNARKNIDKITEDGNDMTEMFSERIQSRVTNQAPMRPLIKNDDPYTMIKEILRGFKDLMPILTIDGGTDMLAFFLKFSASRPRPKPIVRAALQSETPTGFIAGKNLTTWATRDMRELSCAAYDKVINSNNPTIKENVDLVLERAGLCYSDVIMSMSQNRSRQRQSLCHCIVSFDSLQVDAESLESRLAGVGISEKFVTENKQEEAVPISSWVYLRKLNLMIWVALLGFELDCYKLWEYPRMYYYCDYLLTAQLTHLTRTITYLSQRPNTKTAVAYLKALHAESTIVQQLVQSALYLGIAFDKFKLLNSPKTPMSSPELMYNLRMKPFSSVGIPQLPDYNTYDKFMHRFKNGKDAALLAKTCANKCSKSLDGLIKDSEEMKLLKKSAVGILVQATQLEKKWQGDVELNKDYHWFFPIPSLK